MNIVIHRNNHPASQPLIDTKTIIFYITNSFVKAILSRRSLLEIYF